MSSNLFRYVVNRHYDASNNTSALQHLTKGSESMIQRMSLMRLLDNHRGCVNTIVWSDDGNFLLSGSDDQHLVISDPWQGCQLKRIHTAHRANIFSAKFLPHKCNKQIVSCSGDGVLVFTDLEKEYETYDCKFVCHVSTCYDVLTIPDDPHSFLSCGEDGTVRWFDLRLKEKCLRRNCQEDVLLNVGKAVTAIAVNPVTPYHLAIAAQDSTVRIYDRRMLGTSAHDSYNTESDGALLMRLRPDSLEGKNHRVTSLRYSPTGQEVLASFSSDYLYLFDTQNFKETELEGATGSEKDEGGSSGPTLKRLRLRGDWSDTGPQALPESETRNQAGDVSQARPTLHATLMQRMTDVLSRMLNDPGTRAAVHRTVSDSREEERRERSEAPEDGEHSLQEPGEPSSQPQSSQSEGNIQSSLSQSSIDVSVQGTAGSAEEAEASSASVSGTDSTAMAVQACTLEEANGSRPTHEEEPMEVDNVVLAQSQEVKHEPQRRDSEERDPPPEQGILHSNIDTLEDRLSSMRRGFIDRHRVEPAVSLSYSGRGVTSGVISLGVGDEVTRQPYSQDEDVPAAAGATIDFEETSQMSSEESHPIPDSVSPTTSQSHVSSSASAEDATQEAAATVAGASGSSGASASREGEEPLVGLEEVGEAVRLHFDEGLDMHSGSPIGQVQRSASQSLPLSRLASQPDEENLRIGHDDIDSDEEASSNSTRSASARMAIAIDRALRRSRDETAGPNVGGPRESFAPLGSVKQCYKGHRNARTMIKEATFWGRDHVMSGSDCGRIFVWNLHTGRLVMLWEADRHVVNCVQPHPLLPVLATSGIDYDIKLWAPLHEEPHFDEDKAAEIMRRNEVLLEETRDTITVPASFMIRMLASLNQIRRGRWRSRSQASDTEEREQ
ncbi:DDB1- and CUL4-associated factor 6-like isoform X2 [Oratosquilla oratoria]|uniref:DDB1- and CUL4-associated factor 6-like isoform X2 n=1 Tax=Oratosquilla oratoria TaxID=337810 RepID=UPI003F75A2BB